MLNKIVRYSHKILKTLVIIFFFLMGTNLLGQSIQPLVFPSGKNLIGKDVIQIEVGSTFERPYVSLVNNKIDWAQYSIIKYGINKNLDFSFRYNLSQEPNLISDQIRRTNGISDFSVEFKRLISKNISLKSDVGISKSALGETLIAFQVLGISEHQIDEFLKWENNLGIRWNFDNPQSNLAYLSSLNFRLATAIDLTVAFYGQYNPEKTNNYANLGFGYFISPDFKVETFFGYGNTTNEQTFFGSINLYFRLIPLRYTNPSS